VLVALVMIGCGSPSDGRQPVTLRVSAPNGLSHFGMDPAMAGSVPAALDLAYELASKYADVVDRDGATVTLRVHPDSPIDVRDMTAELAFEGLVGASVTGPSTITARFRTQLNGLAGNAWGRPGHVPIAVWAVVDCGGGRLRGESTPILVIAVLPSCSRSSLLIALVAVGCGGPPEARREVVLRVGAADGLTHFDMATGHSGSTAHALDLAYDPIGNYADIVSRDGAEISIRLHPDAPVTAVDVAAEMTFRGTEDARAVDSRTVVVRFHNRETADLAIDYGLLVVATGPFALDSEDLDAGWTRLRARGDSPIDIIEIVAVDAGDQWRRLHARALDVVPDSPGSASAAYRGIDSIRTIPYPVTRDTALFFNVTASDLADPAVRRRLAALIDRRALAAVACGDAGASVPGPAETGPAVPLPPRLSVIYLDSASEMVAAARAMALQLRAAGVALELEPVGIDELDRRGRELEFELCLAPLPRGDEALRWFLADTPLNQTGWRSPAFDDAVARGDRAEAWRLLAAEMPGTPLFELRAFAAIDARFCGGKPQSVHSWRWLADLYPCDQEPR